MLNEKKGNPARFPFFFSAEDEGFKPPIRGKAYTGFRVQRIRSLCQSSFAFLFFNRSLGFAACQSKFRALLA